MIQRTYIDAIDDCIELLSQLYEETGDGAFYNSRVKSALERLKETYIDSPFGGLPRQMNDGSDEQTSAKVESPSQPQPLSADELEKLILRTTPNDLINTKMKIVEGVIGKMVKEYKTEISKHINDDASLIRAYGFADGAVAMFELLEKDV